MDSIIQPVQKKDTICDSDSDDDIIFSPARHRKHSTVAISATETPLPAKEKQYNVLTAIQILLENIC